MTTTHFTEITDSDIFFYASIPTTDSQRNVRMPEYVISLLSHVIILLDTRIIMTNNTQVHMDPGAFGFIPYIDRKNGYYLEVVAAETTPTGSYPLSGIPEYLAVALKPHVDAILSDNPPDSEAHLHYTPSLFSLGLADVNYCLDCKLYPDHCA